ncbi:uncharacterized protein MKZ38_009816 [Zalerion maritima]|uniref:Uncharacterized protein n=1 Tax=Zalerion maritima TaxID=339359 RepID=A0AAD5WYG6_9PEZI|nr:uncharacterized protein MKZ38_009816 [Zalerion maritima]
MAEQADNAAALATGESGPGTGIKDFLPIPNTAKDHELDKNPSLSHALARDPVQNARHPCSPSSFSSQNTPDVSSDQQSEAPSHTKRGSEKQTQPERDAVDLGWNKPKSEIPSPLVPVPRGKTKNVLDNEELWLLTRRFNKQIYHVKTQCIEEEYRTGIPGGLDLNIADEEEFSPDKLRATVERLYMTVIVGLMGAVAHAARLRSWRKGGDRRRSVYFCAAYFTAWTLDLLVPTLIIFITALILYPHLRSTLFPPAPLALVDKKSGGVQKPPSGTLGSEDSVTGAEEEHKGEAVEKEASNFVNGVASVALASATGKHPQGDPSATASGNSSGSEYEEPEGDGDGKSKGKPVTSKRSERGGGKGSKKPSMKDVSDATPDPTVLATAAADSQDRAKGGVPTSTQDKTKAPVENAMWAKMRPLMRGLMDMVDAWERFGNALSPTPPFPLLPSRLRIATLILPLLPVSLFTSSYMFTKATTFILGAAFFGDPILQRGLSLLNREFPHWKKLLELRNTVLKGVPTDAQLTLTLLRLGERRGIPLVPPPRATGSKGEDGEGKGREGNVLKAGAEHLDASDGEIERVKAQGDYTSTSSANNAATREGTDNSDIQAAKTTSHGRIGSKILNFFKGTTKAGVKTAIAGDVTRAKFGVSRHAKERLGVVPPGATEQATEELNNSTKAGPTEFEARWKGRKGRVVVVSRMSAGAVVSFCLDGKRGGNGLEPQWTVPIEDIVGLKKLGGYGWKAKIVIGWSLQRPVRDGLEVEVKEKNSGQEKEVYRMTALDMRDELFNRLVAIGGQRWVSW